MIARHKTGNCTNPECNCDGVNIPVVKIGRIYYCLNSRNKMKGKEQFDKQVKKQQQRNGLKADNGKIRALDNKLLDGVARVEFDKLQTWYRTKDKESTGVCFECGGKTCKGDRTYWKYTICHIFAKSIFPSIQSHPLNHVELCYFNNSHHSNMDNNGYEYVCKNMPKTWALIVERANILYPLIKEKSKIPDIIMQEIKQPKL